MSGPADTPAPRALAVGKLPVDVLAPLLDRLGVDDPRVVLGPGIGLDCAVVDGGDRLMVYKSDPITFATDEIGHYLVQVNANDIATTGAVARWLLVTLLLPEGRTTAETARGIMAQVHAACSALGIVVIGGHTEITAGLDRPIAVGAMVGEVARERLITPRGARAGDRLLITKGVPIEATSLLAREFPQRLRDVLSPQELGAARDFLHAPGIGVTRDARVAITAGRVTAMHDPTEGGVASALWEMAEASALTVSVDPSRIPIPALARRVCVAFGIDPLASIASGALLIAVDPADSDAVCAALRRDGIDCAAIGALHDGPPRVERVDGGVPEIWPRPEVDAIAAVYAGACTQT